MKSNKVICVVGPTASGKSALAIELAKRLSGQIISCDSMQIYRDMNIGTAKPTDEEMTQVRHHMIDICDPCTDYSCAQYAEDAKRVLDDLLARGITPIFCGGTGLYLDAVLTANRFAPDIPKEVEERVAQMPIDEAYAMLCQVDAKSAEAIHKNNEKRVRRALAVYLGTGKTKSEWDEESRTTPSPYDAVIIGLDYTDRQTLYDRINKRVDLMIEQGLLDEAKRLNLDRKSTAGQAIGYKELYGYLDGEQSLDEALELLKKNTRNYAKRQLTWFRRNKDTHWLYPDKDEDLASVAMALILEK